MLTQSENRINEIDTRSLVNTVVKKTVTKIIPGGSKLSPVSQMSETLAVNLAVLDTVRSFRRRSLSYPDKEKRDAKKKMWRSVTISLNGKFVDRDCIVWKPQLIQLAGIPPHFPGAVTSEVRIHSGESISVYGSTRSLINADPSKGIPPRTVQPLSFMFSHLRPRTIKLSDWRSERVHAWLNHCEPVCLFEMTLEINGETAE